MSHDELVAQTLVIAVLAAGNEAFAPIAQNLNTDAAL